MIYINWEVYLPGVFSLLSLGLLELHYSQKESKGVADINLQEKEVTRILTIQLLGVFSCVQGISATNRMAKAILPSIAAGLLVKPGASSRTVQQEIQNAFSRSELFLQVRAIQ